MDLNDDAMIQIQGLQTLTPPSRNLALKRTRSLPFIYSHKDLTESVLGTSIRKLESEGNIGCISFRGYVWECLEVQNLQSSPPEPNPSGSNALEANKLSKNRAESNKLNTDFGSATVASSPTSSAPSRATPRGSHGTDREVSGKNEDKMEASSIAPAIGIVPTMYDGLNEVHLRDSINLKAGGGSTTLASTPTRSTSSRCTSNGSQYTDHGASDTSEEKIEAPSPASSVGSTSEFHDILDGRCAPTYFIPNANEIGIGPKAGTKHEIQLSVSQQKLREGKKKDELSGVSGESLSVEGSHAQIRGTAKPMIVEETLPTLQESNPELDEVSLPLSTFEEATESVEALLGQPASACLTLSRPERGDTNTPKTASLEDAVAPRPAPPVSGSSSKICSPRYRPDDVIKRVPKPDFPIRARHEGPRTFNMKAQNSKMRWTHDHHHFVPDACWLVQPDLDQIMETVWPWLDFLDCEKNSISISFLAEGGFNKVYAITSKDRMTKEQKHYVFRVTLPIDPWFKTECDVATTEIVRLSTNIPVPKIYAFDSSAKNELGLEWILMERIMGRPASQSWVDLDYDAKVGLTRLVADWTKQLSALTSNKIGGLYMDFEAEHIVFYVGRSVHTLLNQDGRLLYNIERGPYETLGDFYEAVLAVTEAEIPVLKWKVTLGVIDNKQRLLERRWALAPGSEEENWKELQLKELDHLQIAVEALRESLPELWNAAKDAGTELFTILSHHDISLRNILVDDACKPLALLDWESIQMEPLIFIQPIPEFLQGPDAFDLPDAGPDLHVVAQKHNWSPETLQEVISSNQNWWREKMEEYTLTKLRDLYRKELENSKSPLARAAWTDHDIYDRQLYEHIMMVWEEDEVSHVEWVDYQFDGEDMDSDENDEGKESIECVEDKEEEIL